MQEGFDLVKNAIYCKKCKMEIESKSTHDWVQCKCTACFVDGGLEYTRVGGERDDWEDRSEYRRWTDEQVEKEVQRRIKSVLPSLYGTGEKEIREILDKKMEENDEWLLNTTCSVYLNQ